MRHVNEKKFSPSAEGLKDKNKDKDVVGIWNGKEM